MLHCAVNAGCLNCQFFRCGDTTIQVVASPSKVIASPPKWLHHHPNCCITSTYIIQDYCVTIQVVASPPKWLHHHPMCDVTILNQYVTVLDGVCNNLGWCMGRWCNNLGGDATTWVVMQPLWMVTQPLRWWRNHLDGCVTTSKKDPYNDFAMDLTPPYMHVCDSFGVFKLILADFGFSWFRCTRAQPRKVLKYSPNFCQILGKIWKFQRNFITFTSIQRGKWIW